MENKKLCKPIVEVRKIPSQVLIGSYCNQFIHHSMKGRLLLRSLSISRSFNLTRKKDCMQAIILKVMYCVIEIDTALFVRMVVLGRLNELAKEWIIDVSLAKVRPLIVYLKGIDIVNS